MAEAFEHQRTHEFLRDALKRLTRIEFFLTRLEIAMADLSKLTPAFTKFASDFSQFKTDLTTFLGTLKPEDPAVQAAIDGFTTQAENMDTDVQAMDASLKPAAPTT